MDKELGKRLIDLRQSIVANFSAGDWEEVGLLTGHSETITTYPRLLRSLSWGDEDYAGNVLGVLRRISEAPRGSQLHVVPRGTARPGLAGAVAVRMTLNPDAQGVIAVDRHEIFPYRQKDVVERLKKALPTGMVPNTYDLQAINTVYKIAAEKDLSWKPDFSSRQYSEAFVEWIVVKVDNDKDFLKKTRRRFREMSIRKK